MDISLIHHTAILPSYFWHPLGYCPAGPSQLGCKGYNLWSGIQGSFLTSVPGWLIALLLFLRHQNCHSPWCLRIGKHPVEGTPYRLCKKHHPAVPDKLTLQHIIDCHNKAVEGAVKVKEGP